MKCTKRSSPTSIRNNLIEQLLCLGQPHLAKDVDQLSISEQAACLAEARKYSKVEFQNRSDRSVVPVTQYDLPSEESRQIGRNLLSQGKVGCLILAGGQGTRLGGSNPKALTPVTPIYQKTLLQIFCEKGTAAAKTYGSILPIAVMTSPSHHESISDYLRNHHYFGLPDITLFPQNVVPLLDQQHRWFWESKGVLATGPNGNGEALHLLSTSGIRKRWQEQGVEYVIVLPIDNPLADPFDAVLCGFHAMQKKEATIKGILKDHRAESLGAVVSKEGKIGVQEYYELPSDCIAPVAHIGLFCFSLSWIQTVQGVQLPWHFAHKSYRSEMIWKPEKFLFDLLFFANEVGVVVYPREDVFAPLKNHTGEDSLPRVQEALHRFDQKIARQFTDEPLPTCFELDPMVYYLRGRGLWHSDYIHTRGR